MSYYRYVFFLIFFIFFSFDAYPSVFFEKAKTISDDSVLIYKGKKVTDDPLALEPELFGSIPARHTLGYTWDKKWFIFHINNATDSAIDRLLLLDDGFMFDEVVFYHVVNGKVVKVVRDGVKVPASAKEIFFSGAVTKVHLPANTSAEIYISTKTKSTTIISLRLMSYEEFYKSSMFRNLFLGGISAALISIALYNLFLFFSLRLIEYIYYVLYVTSAIVFFQAQTGFMNEFYGIYGDSRTWMFISVYFMGIFLMLFSQQVLDTKNNLRFMHELLNIIIFLNIIGVVAALIFGMKETLFIQTPFAQLSAFCLAILSLAALYKRVNSALYYFLADGLGIMGIVVSSVFLLGMTEYSFFTRNAYFVASVGEAVLLSLLLSYRINSLRIQKITAQEELISLQKSTNQKLEEAVIVRTQELHRKNEELHNLSILDELTGLYNRRFLMATFSDKLNRVRDDEKLLAFMMLDIDFFKNYNDKYGHQAGDAVLKRVSSVLANSYRRSSDYVFRIGGEEFVALYLVDTVDEAISFAETVRHNLENEKIEHELGLKEKVVTCSIGLFVAKAGLLDFETIYKRADEQLYIAKNSGRNRVSFFKADESA